jgi:hypothetical protein
LAAYFLAQILAAYFLAQILAAYFFESAPQIVAA